MLKFRVDRRARLCDSDMSGKVNTTDGKTVHTKSAITVSCPSPAGQTYSRMSRTPRKAATFGKRSNSMRRNPTANVTIKGWLYKQASSGVKQWNRRWFVLADRCLFYYKDEKEDSVLGSLPLLSFQIGAVELSDNITRKFAFKVWLEDVEDSELKDPTVFCMQAEHAGTRTYYFSTDSHEEQQEWIKAMSEAAEVKHQLTQRPNPDTTNVNNTMVTNELNPQTQQHPHTQTNNGTDNTMPVHSDINDVHSLETSTPPTPTFEQDGGKKEGKLQGVGKGVEGGQLGLDHTLHPSHYSNGWSSNGPPNSIPHNNIKNPPSQKYCGNRGVNRESEISLEPVRNSMEQHENVVLRRGFVPRTAPEKVAQRKSSMAQLQQWVNQRRAMASQEDINSPSAYFPVNRGVSADFYAYPGGPPYMNEYPLYQPGIRPDSICSMSAVGIYDRTWTAEEKRRSLRDGPHKLYGSQMHQDTWGPPYYSGMETSMRRLSIQPRSRSVPRSPSSSSGGPYSPVPHNFASPARSPSTRFDRLPGRVRDDLIYADPSVYSLRRSLSSPKYDLPGERRSVSQGLFQPSYPVSPSFHSKMEDIIDLQLQRNLDYLDQQVPPFYDNRELHPTLKLNEIETSKLLGQLCEQNRILKDHMAVVHRLRMDKDSLEEALVSTHQEMELYHNQPLIIEKLQFKKEAHQNQLINIRGELSQASSALTTTRMKFEALEDEANAIHGDLWEQLNTGGQTDLVRRHIQKEFWRVQDVLEGLHKNNSSRGTDTAKHRVASGASGSFSTNSSASPLSSVSLTSPLSPYSSVPGCHTSPTKQLGLEENVPPRPPLPKSYYPLEPSSSFLPSIPPLPTDSTAWLRGLAIDGYFDDEDAHIRKAMLAEQNSTGDMQEQVSDRQSSTNKVGIVPPRTKSPTCDFYRSSPGVSQRNGRSQNGATRERPKSAVFPAEIKSKMSIEEQNERIRRNQSNSVKDKRRSLNLSSGQTPANYRVVRRRLTAHEIEIKDLEVAVRGQGHESPQEEIARLRRLHIEPERYDMNTVLMAPDKDVIPGRYIDVEEDMQISPEDQKEKQKKLERIKTLIAKSNLQNIVPLLDGPVEDGVSSSSQRQLQEQEKRIEISCALAAEASRRSRLLSAQCSSSPSTSPTGLVPTPSSADFPNTANIMKV